ncbi:MFS transporter [Salmonella enterica subsp. enterica serovar Java]|nr:MFS transporter [Salmonella enterica subsp. enterica serovar Java]
MEIQAVEPKSSHTMILICILIAVFVVPTSISGTAIALPAISAELRSQTASQQWVVNAFNLTFASFTLAWGGLADVFGSKKAFIAGAGLYFLASVLSWGAGNIYSGRSSRAGWYWWCSDFLLRQCHSHPDLQWYSTYPSVCAIRYHCRTGYHLWPHHFRLATKCS